MNTGNYNRAIDKLVGYRRMAVLAERVTSTYTTYIDKLESGSTILSIACDKDLEEVYRDVCEAYNSKYCD